MTIDLQSEFLDNILGEEFPFREAISYTPYGGVAKTIYGVMRRDGAYRSMRQPAGMRSVWEIELIISTDATDGIELVTIKGDKVDITAYESGGGTKTYTVGAIMGRTPMAWRLGLTA